MPVTAPAERRALIAGGRYRVDARPLPFTPSWFWEIIDTLQGAIVENSLALSRSLYRSSSEALAAGLRYVETIGARP
jgi:hypothetical protein